MISIQAKIILGIFAFVLVASGLTIWLILAWGNGFFAMIAPLVVAAVLLVVTRLVMRREMGDRED
jgi:hypothetical protein